MINPCLRIATPGSVVLNDAPLPQLADGEVGVCVNYVALCGSDVKLYHGTYSAPHSYPIVLGHEWVGKVEQVTPSAAAQWKIGDLVTGDCSLFCGQCWRCKIDVNHCLEIEKRGITRDGACARHIAVNVRHLHRCPAASDIKPFALSEPLSVAFQGIHNRVPAAVLARTKKALIIGGGGIGIASLIALLEAGVPNITIADPVAQKRALIASFGLDQVQTVSAFPPTPDTYDLIVEAAGSGAALSTALCLAAPLATIVCLGHQGTVEIDGGALIKKSLNLIGSIGSSGGFERAIAAIPTHRAIVEKMITRTVPITDAAAFFKNDLDREVNVKVVIDLTSIP
jgi:threonine dehydrogenase-like Zn-dependent dehydrogenase